MLVPDVERLSRPARRIVDVQTAKYRKSLSFIDDAIGKSVSPPKRPAKRDDACNARPRHLRALLSPPPPPPLSPPLSLSPCRHSLVIAADMSRVSPAFDYRLRRTSPYVVGISRFSFRERRSYPNNLAVEVGFLLSRLPVSGSEPLLQIGLFPPPRSSLPVCSLPIATLATGTERCDDPIVRSLTSITFLRHCSSLLRAHVRLAVRCPAS